MPINAIQGVHFNQRCINEAPTRVYNRSSVPVLKHDVFIKRTNLSFKGGYQKEVVQNYINQIELSKVKPLANGWQCEFYKMDEEIGVKVPKPLHPEIPPADFEGRGNVKEYFALKKINEISSDIAVQPHDLINQNGKNYLVMDFLKGEHPYKSKLTNAHLDDILNKAFILDTNGILNNDLQGGNIILVSKEKTKFIDFGSFSLLTNNGEYINSDVVPHWDYQNGTIENRINSTKEGKFIATYYFKINPETLMRSDNPFLKIESNTNVFEYRAMYDYLRLGREEKPKEFFAQYLKTRAQTYHEKMINFLETLDVNKNDTVQYSMHQNAIEQEKVFKEVLSTPSDNVIKSELGRIQLKWLINNKPEYQNKAFNCFSEYMEMIRGFGETAQGTEKKYYEAIKTRMSEFNQFIGERLFCGKTLNDNENMLKIVFGEVKAKVQTQATEIAETARETVGNRQVASEVKNSGNKKIAGVLTIAGLLSAAGIYVYKKQTADNDEQLQSA